MKKSVFIFLALMTTVLSAATPEREVKMPLLKSMILPGWGEYSYRSQSAYIFWGTEAALWVSFAALRYSASVQNSDMLHYAVQHAGIVAYPNDKQYWTDLSNYISYSRHKERMLENRTPEKIWDSEFDWEWDSETSRTQYSSLYRKKELTVLSSEFVITGLIVNRIASMINVRYLKQKNMELSATAAPLYGGASIHLGLRF